VRMPERRRPHLRVGKARSQAREKTRRSVRRVFSASSPSGYCPGRCDVSQSIALPPDRTVQGLMVSRLAGPLQRAPPSV
jgi:hypothetical protein